MQRIHVEGTSVLLEAAAKANVKRFIHMSALGARPDAVSAYHRSKWDAEKRVRQSGLEFTIFRPSVVFGKGGPKPSFLSELAQTIQRMPVVPVVGDGEFPLQPVHTTVVADVFAKSLTFVEVVGETFDVCGPNVVTYKQIVEQLMSALEVRKRMVHVPMFVLENALRLLDWTGLLPLTMDQLIMLREGNVSANAARAYERFAPPSIPFSIQPSDLE